MAGSIRVGISGWTYAGWRGVFYPEGLPHRRELEFASRQVNSIEINGSFYSLQRPESWGRWYDAVPEDFIFSVKGGRYITHLKRLRDIEAPLANFFASGVLLLREKLGPILWQFPPHFSFDPERSERIERFFELLPRETSEAARLAPHHSDWLDSRSRTRTDRSRPIRHAMEIRNLSFRTPEFIRLLRKHEIALVVSEAARRWPFLEDATSDFVYARLHGEEELYVTGYDEASIERWAGRVRTWASGGQCPDPDACIARPVSGRRRRDVFVYFDNDVKARAPFDAMRLLSKTSRFIPAFEMPTPSGGRVRPRLWSGG